MVLLTAVSFEKSVYQQEETIRGPSFSLAPLNSGHVDVDIEQYEAPTDGRREDYICRFRAYGQFSFQQPEFRKSTMPLWKRGRDKIASWQSFVIDGTSCEFSVDSRDCPYLLKPGRASRVRSIPFKFQMPGPTLPASFTSSHGRARLEYVLSATTTTRKGVKSVASNAFLVNPSPPTTTFQMYQHSFNVDVLNGGAHSELTASIRNIITVSYPVQLIQRSMQNLVIQFPDERFKLKDATIDINSKLLIHGAKSTFAIEEDTVFVPCTATNDYLSPSSQVLSFRVPSEITESFTVTFKRTVVKKSESLKLQFGYQVRTETRVVECTSSCEFSVVVVGLPSPEPSMELNHVNVTEDPAIEPVQDSSLVSETDPETQSQKPEPRVDALEPPICRTARRSSVRALRGILKKPRQEIPPPEEEIVQDIPAAIERPPSVQVLKDTADADGVRTKRASLQLAAFDRMMFAKRGAELRNEYLRDFSGT